MRLIGTDRRRIKYFSVGMMLLICSLSATGQVLRGMATNGTTKKPAAGDDVVLLKLDKGMDEEARTKTNSRGEFSFELPDSQVVRAVRVRHQNVNYFQPVFPGSTSVAVTVYEASATVPGIRRLDESMVIQAQGNALQVYQIFNVENNSQPPRTQPNFTFYLPEGATVVSGEAIRAAGMPLKSVPVAVEGEANKYQFLYPLIPGKTHFEAVYRLTYTGAMKFDPKFVAPANNFYVVTPKSLRFAPESGSQYQASDQWPVAPEIKGVDVHAAGGSGQQLAFQISGEGLLPQQEEQTAQEGNSRQAGAEDNRPGGGMGIPNERPNPLSSGQWAFLGVLTLFLAGGAAFVFMNGRNGTVPVVQSPKGSAPLLDALRDEMFQLEADRVQGKIAPKEYEAAKAALDKTLQRAMRKSK